MLNANGSVMMTENKKLTIRTMTSQSTVSNTGEIMEGGKQAQELISALMDSELAHLTSSQINSLPHSQEQKNTWSLYHQIGDLLRFEHQNLSHDFQIKMSNRLAQEAELGEPHEKWTSNKSLASKKLLLIVATLVLIVVVPSTVFIVKSSISLQEKKVSDESTEDSAFIKPRSRH